MGNPYGRLVVLPLTNKSGGGVVAGDVVIVDTANNDAFTTTTTGAFTGCVGIAQQTIGSNAVGLVLVEGYAALVNVNASVTRGHFAQTHTVAKQASDAGASRQAGTFGIFLTGGTTPDALIWQPDLGGGTGMTNPMTNVGDIIQGTTAGAPQALASPAAGKVLTGAGTTTPLVYAYPPGYELSYVEFTSDVTISATSEATADTIVSAAAVSFDGSTVALVEFYSSRVSPGSTATTDSVSLWLYDGSSSIGQIAFIRAGFTAAPHDTPVYLARRLTPSNASHTYSVRGSRLDHNATVAAGVGGSGAVVPGFIRITKV